MGSGHSKQPIKDRLKPAFRLPWARAKKGSDSEPQQSEKHEISVTQTITQDSAPVIRAPSLLAPPETRLVVASGILSEPLPKQPFLRLMEFSGEPFTMPRTPLRLNISESLGSHNMQSPPEVSPMSDQSTVRPLANQLGNITWSEPTSEHIGNVSPISQTTIQPLANQPDNITWSELISEHIDNVNPTSQATIQPLVSQLDNLPPLDLASRYESDPNACHFCKEPYSDEGEPKVYLPCGHSFGVNCLFQWIEYGFYIFVTGRLPFAHMKCPHDCIALRHPCGHLVTPYDSMPHPLHTDASAFAIPSAYEFCRKGRGSKLSRNLKWLRYIEKALVREPDLLLHRAKQLKILHTLNLRRPPFRAKLLSMATTSRFEAERILQREHRAWWLYEWGKRLHNNTRESLFFTYPSYECELQRDFLRDLELLGLEQ